MMKNLNRNGELLFDPKEDSGEAVEQAMETAVKQIIWPSLIAAAFLGLFCATGFVIGLVKFCNWMLK